MSSLGKQLILLGVLAILAGVFLVFRDSMPFLKSLGRLPGDITYRKGNFSFYFPVVTSILLSVILSLILYLFNRLR